MAAELPMPDPPLANAVVALRPWSDGDLSFIVAACREPVFERFTAGIPSPFGEQDGREWLAGQEPARRAGHGIELAVVAPSSGEPLGAVSLTDVSLLHRRAAMGYWLAERARGRGAATEAVRLLAGWAVDVLGLERLEAFVHPENVASQRVVERCGFTREGLLRGYMLKLGRDERRDAAVYGVLAHELRRAGG
jgi:RimJ/RimL family protein N-acetyltransferase